MVGLVVSTTVIVCVFDALVLPHASIACQLRASVYVFPHPWVVVSPSGTTVAPPQVSLAVGELKVGLAGHSTVPSLPTSMRSEEHTSELLSHSVVAFRLLLASITCQLFA